MQRWGYGINGLYKSCHVHLEEGPWWAWLLERISDICIVRWRIPFLDRIHITRDDEKYTVAGWYGDTWDDFWHSFVTTPLFDFAYRYIKITPVPLSWEECRRIFYTSNPAYWDEAEADPEFGSRAGPSKE